MDKLNLPTYQFRIQTVDGKQRIFDRWRKKFVALTPEEWVRQNFIRYLVEEKRFPESLIAVETGLVVGRRSKRTDAVVYDRQGRPFVIIECKAPDVAISQKVFEQIVRYNITLQVNYLMVTNGLNHYCCHLNYEDHSYQFLEEIPLFEALT
ncbi:MAG: type I restriction enzyme HsdR N-terminal domain-containing protein [Bacteroidetes bacterium]|nr:type I restriction enzyme HsdR N-terminal domain-containing protein [Bacteroidota bacterium]